MRRRRRRLCPRNLASTRLVSVKSLSFLLTRCFFSRLLKRGVVLPPPRADLIISSLSSSRSAARNRAYSVFLYLPIHSGSTSKCLILRGSRITCHFLGDTLSNSKVRQLRRREATAHDENVGLLPGSHAVLDNVRWELCDLHAVTHLR